MSNLTIDLTHELSKNFIDYAMSVNTDRSIPESTTGLKPVHRRILYSMYVNGLFSSKKYVKCQSVVGDVMGQFHPHGDSSIYQALVRLARPWVMRYPLVDFHGNIGNESGDGAAAPRYTECRLAKISEDGLLKTLNKNCVDTVPNYDETREEVVTFPAIFPNLLCNPNSGIGVALASSWGSYNLCEVANAINEYLDGKEITPIAPDFSTAGQIINKDIISSINETGRGTVIIRARYNIENKSLVFYEIPYGTNIETIISQLNDLAEQEKLNDVIGIRDESNLKGIRIVVEFKKSAPAGQVINNIYDNTDLQTSFSFNQVALVNKEPKLLNTKQCIEIYVKHNIECIIREHQFVLEKAKARVEIVDGLLRALEDIDNIISLIKSSKSSSEAKENLISKYNFTEVQAKSIVDMKLGKLAGLEKIELQQEKSELDSNINDWTNIINNHDRQIEVLRSRLKDIVDKYGDERRTQLLQLETEKKGKEKPIIEPKDCVVIITKKNTVKRIDAKSFKTQRRNTVGIKTNGDIVSFSQKTNTQDYLMVFTTKGKVYRLLVDTIPEGTNTSAGSYLNSLIDFEDNERPIAFTTMNQDTTNKYIFFATKKGIVKKVPVEEYTKLKRTGVIAIKIKEEDELAVATFINQEQIMMLTKKGFAIRFDTAEIAQSSRVAQGIKGMKVEEGDYVVAALPIHNPESDYLAIVSKIGLGKKTSIKEFPLQARRGKGVICSKEEIGGSLIIKNEDNILINGDTSSIVVSGKDFPELARTSAGNIMIKNNNNISYITKV